MASGHTWKWAGVLVIGAVASSPLIYMALLCIARADYVVGSLDSAMARWAVPGFAASVVAIGWLLLRTEGRAGLRIAGTIELAALAACLYLVARSGLIVF